MKWILSISLIILLSCVSTLNGEYKKLSEKKIQSMIAHMTKIRNFLRKLEDSDTSGEDESSFDDESIESSEDSSENNDDSNQSKSTSGSESSPSSSSGSGTTPETNSQSTNETTPEESTTTTTSPRSSNPLPIPEPTIPTTVLTTARVPRNNRLASVQVLKFHSFQSLPGLTVMTFGMVMFFQNSPPRFYIVTIVVHHRRGFRNLDDDVGVNKTSNCTLNPNDVGKTGVNVRYDCSAPKEGDEEFDQVVVLPDFKLEGNNPVTLDQLSYSDQAAVGAATLQTQTQVISNLFTLENGELKNNYPDNFIIIGNITGFKGNKGDWYYIQFTNYDESKSNVNCKIVEVVVEKYTFECNPLKTMNGTLHQADIFDPYTNSSITLNMNDGIIYFPVDNPNATSTTVPKRNNPIYRKSSSGLSGGAIAGIVIACAVVLIIGSVIAMMMRKPQVPLDNSASVVGLRTVDNYSQ